MDTRKSLRRKRFHKMRERCLADIARHLFNYALVHLHEGFRYNIVYKLYEPKGVQNDRKRFN